ncbi:DUF1636 domain-containing protein [Sphingomonas morindae]|uniref:DUF1636 domain-containing protein n=1 Tax=Sphingomonas morindae TaxID=1541170 RepID=A0ABY4X6S8_9SPHN|nr:DUF1636 domain-containing protein [Sphingomonas morindae]USI72555.1 DUF1636 domain-containing protein [Sphingomonas morindae]
MWKRTGDAPTLVVCGTCRHAADMREDETGQRGGARLAEALEAAQAADPRNDGIVVERMNCLFACAAHCAVHLRAPGKIGYVLGRFTPDAEAAEALLAFARAYAASAEGRVPFRAWPAGVKGHFLARVPPAGLVLQE